MKRFEQEQAKMEMRTLVIGDIHGAFKALQQCLERSGFDYKNDVLIQLGDVVDSYPESFECVEEMLKINYLISIKGNHDEWFQEFIETDFHPYYWTYGGRGTLISYLRHAGKVGRYFSSGSGYKTALETTDIPQSHKDFFTNQKLYYIDPKRRCFVHGGFKRRLPFKQQEHKDYYWDRSLWEEALESKKMGLSSSAFYMASKFREIYIGHSATTHWGTDQPMKTYNIINLDTGAGHSGRLTIMDIRVLAVR